METKTAYHLTAPVAKPAASITSKSSASQPSKPTPAPAKPQQKKRKLVEDTTEPPSQAKRSKAGKVLKRERYPALLSWGPLPPVVFREPDTGKIQPLPERRTPATTEPSGLVESSSLYAELGLTDSGTDSDKEVSPDMNAQGQEVGQGGTNPGDAGMSQTPSSHCWFYAGTPNLNHWYLGIADEEPFKLPNEVDVELRNLLASLEPLSSYEKPHKELKLITDQFLVEKSQEDEPEKTNTEAEVQSMVTVPIHQDTSSVSLMTTPVIDITDPQSDSTTVPASMPQL
ncbi:hypothetical protein Tco_0844797 [Tanacetum coccineum]